MDYFDSLKVVPGPLFYPHHIVGCSQSRWLCLVSQRLDRNAHSVVTLRKHAHVIYRFFLSCKNRKFSVDFFLYFSYFCSKHRLWVHVRTARRTHNLCFESKIKKKWVNHSFANIKVGYKGVYISRTCFPDIVCNEDRTTY